MIKITDDLSINEKYIQFVFIHASGPGGQNVNKVATAVQLRFDIKNCDSLSDDVRSRLYKLVKRRIYQKSVLVIEAKRYRSQERNRQDAINRLITLIRKALIVPKLRRKTKPTLSSDRKRLEYKRKRGDLKKHRKPIVFDED